MKNIRGKKGSYIVEAALSLPVLLVALLCLSSLINFICICESINFITARELKEAGLNENRFFSTVSLCNEIKSGMEEEHGKLKGFHVEKINWMYEEEGIYDLISVNAKIDFSVAHTIGINGNVAYKLQLKARGFTGAQLDGNPLELSAFLDNGEAVDVMIFPLFGQRYHIKNCSIVKRELSDGNRGQTVDREEAILMGFQPCKLCGGGAP